MLPHPRHPPDSRHGHLSVGPHTAHLAHVRHHALRHLETLDQAVHVRHRGAGTRGDAGATRTIEQLQVLAFRRGHGTHNGFDTIDFAFVELIELLTDLSRTRQHPQHLAHRTEFPDLLQLLQKVLESQLSLLDFPGQLLGLLHVKGGFGLFDQGQDVAHIQDARSHAVGVEAFEVVQALAGRGKQHRHPGDSAHRQRRPTARVAVQLRQHHAGEVHAVAESPGGAHRVLTDHGVQHKQNLFRLDFVAHLAGLLHQLFVHAQTPRGIHNHDVVSRAAGQGQAAPRHIHRVPHPVAGLRGKYRYPGLLCDNLQLRNRVGTLQVGGDQQNFLVLGAKPLAQLARQGSFTSTLQTHQHKNRGSFAGPGKLQFPGFPTQHRHQFIVDDFYDLLGRVQRLGPRGAVGLFLDLRCKVLHDLQGDVGLDQGASNLGDGFVNVCLGQFALLTKVLKGLAQAIRKIIEHPVTLPSHPDPGRNHRNPRCLPRRGLRPGSNRCSGTDPVEVLAPMKTPRPLTVRQRNPRPRKAPGRRGPRPGRRTLPAVPVRAAPKPRCRLWPSRPASSAQSPSLPRLR